MAFDDVATNDGYDIQMQTNHLSHFLLTKGLFPLLQRAEELRGEARIVNHSSFMRDYPSTPLESKYMGKNGGNLGGDDDALFFKSLRFQTARWERYHQTKLANAVFTLALKEKLGNSKSDGGGSNIKSVCAAPGFASTNLHDESSGFFSKVLMYMFAQSASDGTLPLLAACFDPSAENGDFWEPANRNKWKGPPGKSEYSALCSGVGTRKEDDPQTDSVDMKAMLWEMSELACGCEFNIHDITNR